MKTKIVGQSKVAGQIRMAADGLQQHGCETDEGGHEEKWSKEERSHYEQTSLNVHGEDDPPKEEHLAQNRCGLMRSWSQLSGAC